jgi:Peptidase A4 family
VLSEFTVPSAQEPYGVCDDSQYYYAAVWNGIDGYSNGDVLQAGTLSYAYCSGGVNYPSYISWIEWYPSYSIIEAYGVNPGDVIFVETYATSSTQGYLYVYDYYLQLFESYSITPTEKPYLVGNSADYIVERVCCDSAGYPTALANYLVSPAWEQYNYTGTGVLNYSGNTTSKTVWLTMLDDPGTEYISFPYAVGVKSAYSTPAEAISVMSVENCAYSGGCPQN